MLRNAYGRASAIDRGGQARARRYDVSHPEQWRWSRLVPTSGSAGRNRLAAVDRHRSSRCAEGLFQIRRCVRGPRKVAAAVCDGGLVTDARVPHATTLSPWVRKKYSE